MPKSSTGRMSPIRAHTMKDIEQQLSDLKKENFNLKLRIYFLEERQERKWDADGEDLIKTVTNQSWNSLSYVSLFGPAD